MTRNWGTVDAFPIKQLTLGPCSFQKIVMSLYLGEGQDFEQLRKFHQLTLVESFAT